MSKMKLLAMSHRGSRHLLTIGGVRAATPNLQIEMVNRGSIERRAPCEQSTVDQLMPSSTSLRGRQLSFLKNTKTHYWLGS